MPPHSKTRLRSPDAKAGNTSPTPHRSASLSCLRDEYKYIAAIVNPLSGERAASDYVYQSLCQELGHHRVLRLTKEIFADTRPIKNLILEYTAIPSETSSRGSFTLPNATRQADSPSKNVNNDDGKSDASTPLLDAARDPSEWGAVGSSTNASKGAVGPLMREVSEDGTGITTTTTTALPVNNNVVQGDDIYQSVRRLGESQPVPYTPAMGPATTGTIPSSRGVIIVAGGDGTVSFIMQVIDQLAAELLVHEEAMLLASYPAASVAPQRMGTGNVSDHAVVTATSSQPPTSNAAATQQEEKVREISRLSPVELTSKRESADDNNVVLPPSGGSTSLTDGSDDETSAEKKASRREGDDSDAAAMSASPPAMGVSETSTSTTTSTSAAPSHVGADAPAVPAHDTSNLMVSPSHVTSEGVVRRRLPSKRSQQHARSTLPAVAVIAMGTGNDLSNWLGFGLGYTKYKCQPCGACCCCMTACSGKHPHSGRPRNCCINSVEDAVTSLASAVIPSGSPSHQPFESGQRSDESGGGSCTIVQFDRWSTRVVPLSIVYSAVCSLRGTPSGSNREDNDTLSPSPLTSAPSSPHLLKLSSMSDITMEKDTVTKEDILLGLSHIIKKNYTHIAMNYFSFGMDAFIATTFDKLRKAYPKVFQYRLVNKMVYGNLGLYGWQKCKRLDPYIKSLEVGVDDHPNGRAQEGNKLGIVPQRLQTATFPAKTKAFVAANVGSYSGGVKLWDPESGTAKNKYLVGSKAKKQYKKGVVDGNGTLPDVTLASVSDCRLEVQGVGGMLEMGLLQLKVTSADKVAQTSIMRTVVGMPGTLPPTATTTAGQHKGPIIATRDPEVTLDELAAVLPTVVAMGVTDDLLIAVRAQLNAYYRRDSANSPIPIPAFTPPIAFQVDGEPSGTITEPSIVEISPYDKPMFVVARGDKQI